MQSAHHRIKGVFPQRSVSHNLLDVNTKFHEMDQEFLSMKSRHLNTKRTNFKDKSFSSISKTRNPLKAMNKHDQIPQVSSLMLCVVYWRKNLVYRLDCCFVSSTPS